MQRVLSKREKIILIFTIGLIAFSLAFNLVVLPVLRKNDSLNKRIEAARLRLARYNYLLSQKEAILGRAGGLAAGGLPGEPKDAAVAVLSEVEALAKEANIRLVDIRPRPAKGKQIEVDIRTEGDMQGYLNFIYALEDALSLLTVDKYQLSAKINSPYLEGSFSISQISTE